MFKWSGIRIYFGINFNVAPCLGLSEKRGTPLKSHGGHTFYLPTICSAHFQWSRSSTQIVGIPSRSCWILSSSWWGITLNPGGFLFLPATRFWDPLKSRKTGRTGLNPGFHIPSGNLTVCYWKWPSRNSEFSHEKWVDLSIVMWQFTRGYIPFISHL